MPALCLRMDLPSRTNGWRRQRDRRASSRSSSSRTASTVRPFAKIARTDLFHRPGAGDVPAAGLDLRQHGGLLIAEIVRVLQKPAVVLELSGGGAVAGAAQLVPVRAADVVQRLGRQLRACR